MKCKVKLTFTESTKVGGYFMQQTTQSRESRVRNAVFCSHDFTKHLSDVWRVW